MKVEEVIDTLQCAIGCGCSQICSAKYRGECTYKDVTDALEMVIESLEKQLQYKWHTSEEENAFGQKLVPTIGEPVLVMREFTNIRSGSKHKEYDCGYLNEDWEVETEDGSWICDWQDVDAWKKIEPFEGGE